MPDVKLTVTGQIPGEALIVAILGYAETHRATMSQENRDAYDALQNRILNRWVTFWERLGAAT